MAGLEKGAPEGKHSLDKPVQQRRVLGAERGGVVPNSFALGNGGGGVGEKRNCLGRDEVSLKLPDCGSWDDTTLGACRPESSVSL